MSNEKRISELKERIAENKRKFEMINGLDDESFLRRQDLLDENVKLSDELKILERG